MSNARATMRGGAWAAATADGSGVEGASSSILDEIQNVSVGLACWVRDVPSHLEHAFDAWPTASLPNACFNATRTSFRSLVTDMLADCGGAPPSARAALGADLLVLADCFCRQTHALEFACRVESIDDNSCW